MAQKPRPGDKLPPGVSPREWLAAHYQDTLPYEPRINQGNIYGTLGDMRGWYGHVPTAPYIEPSTAGGYPLSDFASVIGLPRRQPIEPLGPIYGPPAPPTLSEMYPAFQIPTGLPGQGYALRGDQSNYVPKDLFQDYQNNMLKRFNIEPAQSKYGVETADYAVSNPNTRADLRALAQQIRPTNLAENLSAVERQNIVNKLPTRSYIQQLISNANQPSVPLPKDFVSRIEGVAPEELNALRASASMPRGIAPEAIIPGAIGSLAAPYIINQLPVSNEAKNVLSNAAAGGSLGSMGFALGPQVGLATTALGTILGGGKALLGI